MINIKILVFYWILDFKNRYRHKYLAFRSAQYNIIYSIIMTNQCIINTFEWYSKNFNNAYVM